MPGHSADVTSVLFSPDGTHVASSSRDKTVKIWNSAGVEVLANHLPLKQQAVLLEPCT